MLSIHDYIENSWQQNDWSASNAGLGSPAMSLGPFDLAAQLPGT